jgi:hypothetical protein
MLFEEIGPVCSESNYWLLNQVAHVAYLPLGIKWLSYNSRNIGETFVRERQCNFM